MCLSQELLNELIETLSENIAQGKEEQYNELLPRAHFVRLKKYYEFRKKYPERFREEVDEQERRSQIIRELEEDARKAGKI